MAMIQVPFLLIALTNASSVFTMDAVVTTSGVVVAAVVGAVVGAVVVGAVVVGAVVATGVVGVGVRLPVPVFLPQPVSSAINIHKVKIIILNLI
jgi:hypothetical protein